MKARIYPAITLFVSLLALLLAVSFIQANRVPPSLLTEVGAANFEQTVLTSKTPVFIEFYKRGCQECYAEFPPLDKLVSDYNGKVLFVRVDLDREPRVGNAFHVTNAPAHAIFMPDSGNAVIKAGFQDEQSLRSFIDRALTPPAPVLAPPAAPPAAPAPAHP